MIFRITNFMRCLPTTVVSNSTVAFAVNVIGTNSLSRFCLHRVRRVIFFLIFVPSTANCLTTFSFRFVLRRPFGIIVSSRAIILPFCLTSLVSITSGYCAYCRRPAVQTCDFFVYEHTCAGVNLNLSIKLYIIAIR